MNDSNTAKKRILVTGGNGFIGSHVAKKLFDQGESTVRIVDIIPRSEFPGPICHEFIYGNLCNEHIAKRAVIGVDKVLHFAANMGGMGAIHEANEARIYHDNSTMTLNILTASMEAGVKLFLYASSACVYPTSIQESPTDDVSLTEDQVWYGTFPSPQGLYGLEKLVSEMLIQHLHSPPLEIRIVRFHNVYGPYGAWDNGREKAPAAMLRKAYALSYLARTAPPPPFEIWGDGKQRRSFLFIDDAVDGVIRLMNSGCSQPVNIGSDMSVTIQSLAQNALSIAFPDQPDIPFSYVEDRPLGVVSRNSNNGFVQQTLGWVPRTSLLEGMRKTGDWIRSQIDLRIEGLNDAERCRALTTMSRSQVLNLQAQDPTFAILLPITSRASQYPGDCIANLDRFAASLYDTTWRDLNTPGDGRYRIKIYLGIDSDDDYLLPSNNRPSPAQETLIKHNIVDIETIICDYPRGHVCSIWRALAKRAWEDRCDYFVLMGDDVVLEDEGWMRAISASFDQLSADNQVPQGFGCVAFTDITFPGMPTFPVIHRTHMEIFGGTVVPPIFINQDGDPFLFQLYRRWGCSTMIKHRLTNGIGGSDSARYEKKYTEGWTFKPLSNAISTARSYLRQSNSTAVERLAIDVVIPCYRVNLPILRGILSLNTSPTTTTMFIVIIDNPASPYITDLEKEYAHRPDIRIRVNKKNLGASETRNRGMKESAADWVHFLDDDVVPDANILLKAEKVIRQHPTAAGFVGSTRFPQSNSIFTTAVHIAGVTFFWDIASNPAFADDVPWGVTANLIARRFDDSVLYDPVYPKTGGGEDIDFCRKKREYFMSEVEGGKGFIAAPDVKAVHPYWNNGKRSYWRFYMWSYGDGALILRFPELTYRDWAPNSAELMCGCILAAIVCFVGQQYSVGLSFLKALLSVFFANLLFDTNQHLFRHPERTRIINSTVSGTRWFLAVLESALIRMASEMGRLHGLVDRRDWTMVGRRFDWFTGHLPPAIEEEKMNSVLRCVISVAVFIFVF